MTGISLRKKVEQLRKKIAQFDLKPDKQYLVKNGCVPYVSGNKIKKQLAVAVMECGLDFSYDMKEIIDLPDRERVKVEFVLEDVDTGECEVRTIFGEGINTTDKAISIAMSYAFRNYFTTRFFMSDGIDFTEEPSSIEEALDDKAVKEDEKPVIPKITVPPVVKKTEEPVKTPSKTEDKPSEVSKTIPIPVKPVKTALSIFEKRAVDNNYEIITKLYSEGKVVEDKYNEIKAARDKCTCSADVLAYMNLTRPIIDDNTDAEKGM